MKVLLVKAPSNYLFSTTYFTPPLGIMYLSSALKSEGHTTRLVDLVGKSVEHDCLENAITSFDPDMIGISSITSSYNNGVEIASFSKQVKPSVITVMGGQHVTFRDEDAASIGDVDFVVRGEGERTITELARVLESRLDTRTVSGITYVQDGQVVRTPPREWLNLDMLASPDRDGVDMQFYRENSKYPWGTLVSSRGCQGSCKFCSSNRMWRKARLRSAESVVEEAKLLVNKYNFSTLKFCDDNFTTDAERTKIICAGLEKYLPGVKWYCLSRIDTVNENLLHSMKSAGCFSIVYGIESANNCTLEKIGKQITIEAACETVELTQMCGIKAHTGFIIGFPNETREMTENTLDVALKLRSDRISFLTPYPGTYYFKHAKELGLRIRVESWDEYSLINPIVETKHLSKKQLYNMWNAYYLKLRRVK